MKKLLVLATLPLILATPLAAQDAEPEYVTPGSVVANSAAEEWVAISAEDLLVMELAPDAAGDPRTVMIQLIPAPFSKPWVENIRTLAAAHWWDGTSVNRVQDNYVTQWGDVTEEKLLPEGVVAPDASYEVSWELVDGEMVPEELAMQLIDATQTRLTEQGWHNRDGFAQWVEFINGWPIANERDIYWVDENDNEVPDPGRRLPPQHEYGAPYLIERDSSFWPIHCYGYVGVGRNLAPDTGDGSALYTIIGQPQRHMDRNLAVVGRVIEGMEHLSSLPRGSGALGFYTEEEAHLRVPILSVRLGSELEDAPSFEYLSTSSESFAQYVEVRANRDDAFYRVPAGGVDICSVQVPVRRVSE